MRLRDKIALVTGAASGIGAATARRFAREGAAVAINDARPEGLEAVAGEIRAAGAKALRRPTASGSCRTSPGRSAGSTS